MLLFLAYDHLGPSGPVGVKIVLLISCLMAVYSGARRSGASPDSTALSCCLGLLTIGPFLGLRPENFGVFWFCIFLYAIRAKLSPIFKSLVLTFILVCWSNFHGSFMLGLILICVKSAIDLACSFSIVGPFYNRNSWKEFLTDALALGLSVIAVIIFNPYGIENLLMPFKQLGTKAVTEYSADWLSVWNSNAAQYFMFGGGSTFWFIFFISILSASVILLLTFSRGDPRRLEAIVSRQNNIVFDLFTCILLIIFAFKFQRLILFAGFALVIPTAIIFQELQFFEFSEKVKRIVPHLSKLFSSPVMWTLGIVLAGVLVFYTMVAVHVGPNPLHSRRSMSESLLSSGSYSNSLPGFINKYLKNEKILAGWEVSSSLLWKSPDVKLLFDTRDQSFFPESVVLDYFKMMGIVKVPDAERLALADKYGLTAFIFSSDIIDFDAAMFFAKSKMWSCIYADPHSLVLVKAESDEHHKFPSLEYPSDGVRLLTQAINSHLKNSEFSSDMIKGLINLAAADPRPNLYSLIVLGTQKSNQCMNSQIKSFLLTEVDRLRKMDAGKTWDGIQIVDSLARIFEILEVDALCLKNARESQLFAMGKKHWEDAANRMRNHYGGRVFQ